MHRLALTLALLLAPGLASAGPVVSAEQLQLLPAEVVTALEGHQAELDAIDERIRASEEKIASAAAEREAQKSEVKEAKAEVSAAKESVDEATTAGQELVTAAENEVLAAESAVIKAEEELNRVEAALAQAKDSLKEAKTSVKLAKKAAKERVASARSGVDAARSEVAVQKTDVASVSEAATQEKLRLAMLQAERKWAEARYEAGRARAVADHGGSIDLSAYDLAVSAAALEYEQKRAALAQAGGVVPPAPE